LLPEQQGKSRIL
jgi:hypothetical protein